jgi:ribosomal protein S12 methylthiotransferase accessory factor
VDELMATLARARRSLFVGLWRTIAFVGPVWNNGRSCCPSCLLTRVATTPSGSPLRHLANAVFKGAGTGRHAPHMTAAWPPAALGILSIVITEGLCRALADQPTPPDGEVFVFDRRDLSGGYTTLLADALCDWCGMARNATMPDLSPASESHPLQQSTLRAEDADVLVRPLERIYVHKAVGVVNEILYDLQSPMAACTIELPIRWGKADPAIGRAGSFRRSRSIALLEALERYAGWHRGGRPRTVRASFEQVAGFAVDPRELGVHPKECYERPGYPFVPFAPELAVDWVECWSMRRGRPLLIPERYAFYGVRPEREPTFVYEISNGCSLGGSISEAALHGLLELVERDSFLVTWYRKLRLPELDLASVTDEETRWLLGKCALFTQCRFHAFDSTLDHGIPSVWLVARHERTTGPCLAAGAGAHPDQTQALKKALFEVAGSMLRLQHVYAAQCEAALPMLADPDLVQRMEDHAMLNALPEARERWNFLLEDRTPADQVPLAPPVKEPWTHYSGTALRYLAERIFAIGLDVLVVNQTMPELRGRLACVKVIIPGLVPITFGHAYRRVDSLPRLSPGYDIAHPALATGWDEVGLLPHPFP